MNKLKLILVLLISILFLNFNVLANDDFLRSKGICPHTKMITECLICHTVPNFLLKEAKPDETFQYPIQNMRIENGRGYLIIRDIDDADVKKFFDYLDRKNIKYAIIEIHSLGGGLTATTRIVNLMLYWQLRGNIIETRVLGFALSGGFMIFIAGTKGYRFASPYADMMWHEIITIEMFGIKISTPSDKEEEARILRHLQDVRNEWIATRGKISKKELDEKIKKKEWWMTGKEAYEYGFVDKLLF